MKAVLAILAFAALILSADAVCSTTACTAPTGTNVVSCSSRQTYYNCLITEYLGCTTGNEAEKFSLASTASGENIVKTFLCGGAGGIAVSVTTLLVALVAAFLKM